MIKLFWNTHNQTSDQKDINVVWGLYHKNNSNKWIYEILKKIQFKIIDSEKYLEKNDILIIIDSNIESKIDFYSKLRILCSKIFLIHLGDESGAYNFMPIYNSLDYTWRTFCSNRYFKNSKVTCLPIGYKSGVMLNKENNERKFRWAFTGTAHKSSRQDLLFQLKSINPSFIFRTKEFNINILDTNELNKILSTTNFIPCPNGFVHPETYRLYEALECQCIPIVENTYKYYDRLFPNNPFLKIDKWNEAKLIIENWTDEQIKKKQEECNLWWKKYKEKIQSTVKEKINYE